VQELESGKTEGGSAGEVGRWEEVNPRLKPLRTENGVRFLLKQKEMASVVLARVRATPRRLQWIGSYGRTTMGRSEGLSQLEQYVLLCLIRLGDEAYGVPIHQEIERRTSRSVSIATVYGALDRLETEGLLVSCLSEPLPERGGRSKRLFRLSPEGATALQRARRVHDSMWEGVDLNTVPVC